MNERLLVIDPHPDDESIYFGGTIAKYAEAGVDVHLLVVTNGEKGKASIHRPEWGRPIAHVLSPREEAQMIIDRQKECLEAAKVLGIKGVTFLGFPDTGVDEKLIPVLKQQIRQIDPHVILAFSEAGTSYEPHKADHAWTGTAAHVAIRSLFKDEFGADTFEKGRIHLPRPPKFSFRRFLTYTLPDAKEKFDNWGEVKMRPEKLTAIDVSGQLGKKLTAVYTHKSQEHLMQFFHSVGLLHQNPEYFEERIYVGKSAKGKGDLFYDVGRPSTNAVLSHFPERRSLYQSNQPDIHDHVVYRYERAMDALESSRLPLAA